MAAYVRAPRNARHGSEADFIAAAQVVCFAPPEGIVSDLGASPISWLSLRWKVTDPMRPRRCALGSDVPNLAASRRRYASALPDAAQLSGRISWQLKPPLSQQRTCGCDLSHSVLPVLKGEFDRLRPAPLPVPLLNFSVQSCVCTRRSGVHFRWLSLKRFFSRLSFLPRSGDLKKLVENFGAVKLERGQTRAIAGALQPLRTHCSSNGYTLDA